MRMPPFQVHSPESLDEALEISSYEEFVHDPINPHSTFIGQLLVFNFSFISEIGVAKSGVKGPFI